MTKLRGILIVVMFVNINELNSRERDLKGEKNDEQGYK